MAEATFNDYDNLFRQPARVCSSPSCIDFGNGDLGRAARFCDDHQARSIISMDPPPRIPRFMAGWEACAKVWAAWLDSEESRKQREYEAEQARQRNFVEETAKGLK